MTCGDIANNLLAFAAYFGKFDAMRVLLRHGADPNDRYDYEPLCYAAMAGHTQSIRILVDAGADVNGGRHGSRPLLFAAERAKLDAARLLLRRGQRETQDGSRRRHSSSSTQVSGRTSCTRTKTGKTQST